MVVMFADRGPRVLPSATRNVVDADGDAGGPSTPVMPGEMMGYFNRGSNGNASGGHQSHGAAVGVPGGLMVSQHGYTLSLTNPIVAVGATVPLTFTITGPDNRPVTEYQVTHDKLLHLIAIRRDTTNFQHVHPVLAGDGTWSVPLDLRAAGEWRIFADFAPTGHDGSMTLGVDLAVTGMYEPQPLPPVMPIAEVDGYTVSLDGSLMPGAPAMLTFSVHKDDQPVTDLQPYLAAYGHLVALRVGDLAYLHVHPDGEPGDGRTEPGPEIIFHATAPSPGTYRLFLDFQHGGVVRTASFTAVAGTNAHS